MTDSISQPVKARGIESLRPVVMGTRHMAVAGHYLAAHAAFDITQLPDVDVDAPIEKRQPGGLGLHLIKRMADSVE